MKTLIIYISIHHKNTEKIAKAIAKVLEAKLVKPHEILRYAQNDRENAQNDEKSKVDINALSEYDLIGFGSGIYYHKHHKSLLNLVDRLLVLKSKKAFIFSTSGVSRAGHLGYDFHKPLKERLLEKGFNIIGEFDCRGWDTVGPFRLIGGISKGRPDEKDLKDAENFARGLKKRRNNAR